ncbi:MAG TPA: lipoate--protein ligase family protein [Verrucomicrobiota bacterium]|nr:lipoate--protein ligase family protein [Verrucomicrobiota bacterium]
MKYLDKTYPTPEENLACDEIFAKLCSENDGFECLRVWNPQQYFVVLGYGNKVEEEVFVEQCKSLNIPIFRRISGGGTVLQGPGCLNYTLVLRIGGNKHLATIPDTNRYVMNKNRNALARIFGEKVKVSGITDLTIDGKKFSGNSQRRFNDYVLYHGTFLIDFDLSMVEKLLKIPIRQPCYRQNRSHRDFLMNIHTPAQNIKEVLQTEWIATETLPEVNPVLLSKLIETKYSKNEWNLRY